MAKKQSAFSDEELQYLRGTHVLIATPCYGEMCSSYYMRSMTGLFAFAAQNKISMGLQTIGNESLITRARNQIVYNFMENEKLTHLMFIDADISFDPIDVFKLVLHKKDVTAAAYPMKGLAWDRVVGAESEEDAKQRSVNYVINMPPKVAESKKVKKTGKIDVKLYNGLLEVYDAGTGFMLISRFTIQALIDNYGEEISYTGDETTRLADGTIEKRELKLHALFDTSIDIETDRYLSEDYTFCRRWQALGGKIWIDPKIVLSHHGSYIYKGYPLIDH